MPRRGRSVIEEEYHGPFVVLRQVNAGYEVKVEPPLAGKSFALIEPTKDAAWGYASRLWTDHRLPFLDFTEMNVGRWRESSQS